MEALTAKQKRFCEEYLIDYNGTRAAIAAGYSPDSAKEIASENLTKPNIKAFVEAKTIQLTEQSGITKEYVLNSLRTVIERCLGGVPVQAYNQDTRQIENTGVWKFDAPGANTALGILAKHVGLFEKDNRQKGESEGLKLLREWLEPKAKD